MSKEQLVDIGSDTPFKTGDRVRAWTFESIDGGDDDGNPLSPRRVEGVLSKWWVEPLQYWQHVVDGISVDPKTVELIEK